MKIHKIISNSYDKYILELVDKEFPIIRKRTYTNQYFLNNFKFMLNDINNWRTLTELKNYPEDIVYHYKYNNEIYDKWVSKDIFKRAYVNMLNNNYFKLKHIKKNKTLNLFVDCSFIINKYGVESITTHPEYHKKKVTKISAICDEYKNILSVVPVNTQTIVSKVSGKKIQSFPHDINSVQETINNMNINVPKYVNVNIIGDKGYITKRIFLVNNKNKLIIAPFRKNQKKKHNKRCKKLLKKRHVIENSLANIKKNERVMIRKDKKIDTYMGFIYLGMLKDFFMRNLKVL